MTAEEETRRLTPVIDQLIAEDIPVSVDHFWPKTQRFAAAHGAAYLNDIQGFPDSARYEALAGTDCRLIVMHSVHGLGPATRVLTDSTVVRRGIDRFFAERLAALEAAGIDRGRLVIDPGLGYFLGDSPEPSLAALAGLQQMKEPPHRCRASLPRALARRAIRGTIDQRRRSRQPPAPRRRLTSVARVPHPSPHARELSPHLPLTGQAR